MRWITPTERNAARAALIEIDQLKNATGLTGQQYEEVEKQAKEKVKEAQSASWTFRDQAVANSLQNTLNMNLLEGRQKSYERLKQAVSKETISSMHQMHVLEDESLHQALK